MDRAQLIADEGSEQANFPGYLGILEPDQASHDRTIEAQGHTVALKLRAVKHQACKLSIRQYDLALNTDIPQDRRSADLDVGARDGRFVL